MQQSWNIDLPTESQLMQQEEERERETDRSQLTSNINKHEYEAYHSLC